MSERHGRSWLITGVCGTVGRELLRQVLALRPRFVLGLDSNESALFFLQQAHRGRDDVRFQLGDIRRLDEIAPLTSGIEIVLHAAAYKHVDLCERAPGAAVATNILGTQNVIAAAMQGGVERVIFTSSDKAVNPTNVMGTSKLMGERLIAAANAQDQARGRVFASTRFGNVLGSSGSVIPVFRHQIAAGGPVTVTAADMTRFIMTLGDAVELVMRSVFLARGGEVMVTKMPVLNILDLAQVMVEELAPRHGHDPGAVGIEIIGAKPGEKRYEELMNDEEVRRSVELPDFFVVRPAFPAPGSRDDRPHDDATAARPEMPYNSANIAPMPREVLRRYLHDHGFLGEETGG